MQLDKRQRLSLFVLLGVLVSLTRCGLMPKSATESASESMILPHESAGDSQHASHAQPVLTTHHWPDSELPLAQVHVVTVPPNYRVAIGISEELKTVDEFAKETGAMAVLNGGFFDPNNAQTTSFVTIEGALVADPRDNQRLIDNSDLALYLDQILNRSEFRRYDCGDSIRYDIAFHTAAVPNGCTLHSALGAGPQLWPNTAQVEGFTDYADGSLIRDAIGTQQRNARSAIGVWPDGTLALVMVAQTTSTGGMTLDELATFIKRLGAQKALNLDGGSSSSLYAAWSDMTGDNLAQAYYGRLDHAGQTIQRPVKSVVLVFD